MFTSKEFRAAWMDCARLYGRWLPPVEWVMAFYQVPGCRLWHTCRDLRLEASEKNLDPGFATTGGRG
jgi:hypothetical protein